jgi:hypothetical protein
VALIPTDDYDILFSTEDFNGIKEALKKRKIKNPRRRSRGVLNPLL